MRRLRHVGRQSKSGKGHLPGFFQCLFQPEGEEAGNLISGNNDDVQSYSVVGMGTYTGDILEIPSTYEGRPVTQIGSSAFWGKQFTEIIIPDTVTELGSSCFSLCYALEKVHLPASLTVVPDGIFCNCEALTTVNLPEGIETIEANAFDLRSQFAASWNIWGETGAG